MNNTAKKLAAIAAAATIGALWGILFAPDKGSGTRRKIGKKGKEFTSGIKNKFRRGKEKFADLKRDIEKMVKGKVENFT